MRQILIKYIFQEFNYWYRDPLSYDTKLVVHIKLKIYNVKKLSFNYDKVVSYASNAQL